MHDKLERRSVSKVLRTVEDGAPFTALRDINRRVAGREFLVVGRSGCGKTPSCASSPRLERPCKGEIWLHSLRAPALGDGHGVAAAFCCKESERFAHDR